MADAQREASTGLVEEFPGKEGGAQAGMKETGQLKKQAVTSGKEDRQDRRRAGAKQVGQLGRPRRIADLAPTQTEMRDLAGGENQQRPTATYPADGFAQWRPVGGNGGSPAKRIDGNNRFAQFRNAAQQGVGQHPDIRPHPAQQIEQDQPLDSAKRVIGNNDKRPLGGNPAEFFVGQVVTYAHAFKNVRGEITLATARNQLIVNRGATPQAEEPFEQRGQEDVTFEDVASFLTFRFHTRGLQTRDGVFD